MIRTIPAAKLDIDILTEVTTCKNWLGVLCVELYNRLISGGNEQMQKILGKLQMEVYA